MSKMPAKKKSCFQITSVTTAQVASSITEDTESLDDPDESRTEDVSSEIFDVSRATDYGPEEVCERSSSEETLNNVGETETPGTVSPNLILDGQLAAASAAPANGGGGVSARSVAGALAQTLAAATTSVSTPGPGNATPSQPPATCSSRFRVIKLDHGSGEPYRRGRWTCMEYYERDSDSSVLTRSGDCIRHSNTLEQTAERDSGLGATGGSVVVVVASMQGAHGLDSGTDSSLTAVSQLPPSEKMSQPTLVQPQQSFSVGQPQPPPPVGGAVAPSSASLPPFSGAATGLQPMTASAQPTQLQGAVAGGALPGPVGQSQPATNVNLAQPVALATQPGPAVGSSLPQHPQQFAYPQPQIPPGHLLPVQPSGQSEYLQPHVALQPPSPAQPLSTSAGATSASAASFPLGSGQSVSSLGAHMMGASSQPSEAVAPGPVPGIQAAPCQPAGVAPAAVGGVVQPGTGLTGAGQPQSVQPLPQMGGIGQLSVVPGGPHTVVPGVPNVPAAVPASSVPSVPTTSVTMPNVPAPLGQSQQLSSHTPVSRSSSVIQQVGPPLAQGTHSAPTSLPQSDLSQFQTQTQPLVGQVDDTRRKSEPLPQPPLSLIAENKPVVKPPVADALANPLQLTPMNSLATSVFSIAIPVDGDEDSASGGGVVAIDNKIEQAMDLVKSHLMYAVREEVEVLKEQIKELVERNSVLERENALLKSLSNNDQLSQLPAQQANPGSTSQQQAMIAQPPQPTQPPQQPNVSSA
ncbi:TSC22 domain family protein 2 isoform X2 [Sigmodon hispidus]